MPIINYPFISHVQGGIARPMLPIRITNPITGQSLRVWGLIDTGADECAIPAAYANQLGHNLTAGPTKHIGTGNGMTIAYSHLTRIEIFGNKSNSVIVHTINDTPIDFMPNLGVILLGVRNFMNQFRLIIDYPNQCFSLRNP